MIMNNENEDNCPVDPELVDNRNANSDKSHSKQLEENEVVSIEKSAFNCFTGALVEQIETMYGLGTMIIHLQDLQAKATSKFEELNIEKRILTEMHDQNRKLQENFYEREVLFPVFRYLIGIADRCRNETNRLI